MLQYILLVGGICLAGFLYSAFAMQIHNGHKKKYLEEHPDASVMIIKDCQWNPLGFNHTVSVLTINGEAPDQTVEGWGERAYNLLPGTTILELQYEKVRPGIIYKSVRTTYDPQKIEVNVEPNKRYTISYDKNSGFVFTEVTK